MSSQPFITAKYRMAYNALKGSTLAQKYSWLFMGCAWLLLSIWMVYAIQMGLGKAKTAYELEHALEGLLFYLAALIFFSAAPLVYGTLFQSKDLEWLISNPIKSRTVASLKIVDGIASSLRIFLPFCIPSFAACCLALKLGLMSSIFSVLCWTIYVFFTALLIQVLLLLVAKLISPARIQNAVIILNFTLSIALTYTIASSPSNVLQEIPLMKFSFPNLVIPGWCANFMIACSKGELLNSAQYLMYMAVSLVGLWYVTLQLAAPMYKDIQFFEAAGKELSNRSKRCSRSLLRPPSLSAGIGAKDFKYYLREPQLLSQVSAPLLIMILPFIFSIRYQNQRDIVQALATLLIGATLYIQTSVLSLSSVSLEARSYWILKSSPISPLRFLFAKWWFCVRFALTFSFILILLMWAVFKLPTDLALLFVFASIVMCAAQSGFGVGLSAIFPKFIWENPSQRVSPWSLLWGFMGYSFYITCMIGTTSLAYAVINNNINDAVAWTFSCSLAALISLAFGTLPMVIGANKLAKLEWDYS